MSNSTIAILSTDLDGTILGRGNHEIGNDIPETLLRLAPNFEFIWVINTGRRYNQLLTLVERAGIRRFPDYLVDRETFLYRRLDGAYAAVEDWNEVAQTSVDQVETLVGPYLNEWSARLKERFGGITIRLDSGVPLSVQSVDFIQSAAVRDMLLAWTSHLPQVRIVRNGIWVSIWADGYDKGTVLDEIARRHNIPRQRIMAVGDSENDLPMLAKTRAGWPVAPGNSEEIVKQFVRDQSGFVSERPDIEGVLDGLHQFAEMLARGA